MIKLKLVHLALNTNHSYVENNSGNCVPVDDKRQHCRLHFGSKLIIVFLLCLTMALCII